jgi:predicted nucleic acid-binding protein
MHDGEKSSFSNGVSGVQVHDARLAAAMYVHGVTYILTLNVADFSRFAGLTPLHPQNATAQ